MASEIFSTLDKAIKVRAAMLAHHSTPSHPPAPPRARVAGEHGQGQEDQRRVYVPSLAPGVPCWARPSANPASNAPVQWTIDGKDYLMDLKAMNAGPGKAPKPDVTLTITEKDFLDLMSGKANGQSMFMSGKIKFKGNMGLVMKLGDLQKMM
jgi:hypothetical protein